MILYQSKENDEILTEEEYKLLTEKEFREDPSITINIEAYRESDTDFMIYDFNLLKDFGDLKVYIEIIDGSDHSSILVQRYDKVQEKEIFKITFINNNETTDILSLLDCDDSENDMDNIEKRVKEILDI